ncbi:MAG: SRPBCC domain-containing protein [Paenibacillaceae bacterium]
MSITAPSPDKDVNPTDEIPEQLGTITFTENNGKTKVTVNYQFTSADDLKVTIKMGMIEGLTMTLGNLANLLNEIQN